MICAHMGHLGYETTARFFMVIILFSRCIDYQSSLFVYQRKWNIKSIKKWITQAGFDVPSQCLFTPRIPMPGRPSPRREAGRVYHNPCWLGHGTRLVPPVVRSQFYRSCFCSHGAAVPAFPFRANQQNVLGFSYSNFKVPTHGAIKRTPSLI